MLLQVTYDGPAFGNHEMDVCDLVHACATQRRCRQGHVVGIHHQTDGNIRYRPRVEAHP